METNETKPCRQQERIWNLILMQGEAIGRGHRVQWLRVWALELKF